MRIAGYGAGVPCVSVIGEVAVGGTGAFACAIGRARFGGFLSHLTFPPAFGGTLIHTF